MLQVGWFIPGKGVFMKNKQYQELFGGHTCPMLITTPQNIFYTAGFSTTARRPSQIGLQCVILTPEKTWFLFPAGWRPLVLEQVDQNVIYPVPYQGKVQQLVEKILELLQQENDEKALSVFGFERDGMELNLYLSLNEQIKASGCEVEWMDISSIFQHARLIKSPEEIRHLRASAAVAKAAMEYAKTILKPGKREIEIVAELEAFMKCRGSEGTPFTMKVLTGENAVRTINLPGDRVIQEGEIVLLDFGATVEHYASDWTRSFAIGTVTEEQQQIYDLVWKVERSCIEMIRPGLPMQDLFDCAMKVLEGNPLARYFNPFLGHSLGINSQEWPTIIPGEETVLKENMVITIEPGIYVPGIGGVRIEDDVLVTADGHEILTGLEEEGFLLR